MLNRIIIPILLILGGLGSIIIANWFVFGLLLVFLGTGASIWMHISSSARVDRDSALLDSAAILMFHNGAGNIYTECLRREILRDHSYKQTFELLRKALLINPNDVDALSLLASLLALKISLSSWARGVNAAQGDVRSIRRLARHGRNLDKTHHAFTDVLGILADVEGNHDIARMWYGKSATLRTDPYWRLLMATSFGMSGNYAKGLFQMTEAIREGADGWLVDFYMGRALASAGRYSEAIPYLEKSKKTGGLQPQLVLELKKCCLFQHLIVRAIYYNLFFVVIISSIAPKNALIHTGVCAKLFVSVIISFFQRVLWVTLGKISGLNKVIARVVRCGYLEQALVENLISMHHFDAALNVCQIAVHRFPGHPTLENNLATCLALCGQRKAAIKVIEQMHKDFSTFDHISHRNLELLKSGKPLRGFTFVD